jgi:hypothetical protein
VVFLRLLFLDSLGDIARARFVLNRLFSSFFFCCCLLVVGVFPCKERTLLPAFIPGGFEVAVDVFLGLCVFFLLARRRRALVDIVLFLSVRYIASPTVYQTCFQAR